MHRRSEPQKVIVRGSGMEIHAYAVETDGEWVRVVWKVASGRCRRRSISAENVFLPSSAYPWAGLIMSAEQLRSHHRAAR
ncbi:MAG: hypothetical protein HOQ07_02945 [Sinomonas sp.]|nr:hypothetical protein [Sinomonas sp.]